MRGEYISILHIHYNKQEPFSQICEQNISFGSLVYSSYQNVENEKEKDAKEFFISVLDKIASLDPTYPQVR